MSVPGRSKRTPTQPPKPTSSGTKYTSGCGPHEPPLRFRAKVYSDFDDTAQCKLFDASFPRATVYPGYVPLMRALRGDSVV